ncbi:hypothetical protein TNCV_3395801 [Trichonephila clavipes]|nr:hypothetical protein TNCV_3395801 [Trichonephila clavipes]
MLERGETDSRSTDSSGKFRATAKNRWNKGIITIINQSVSNSECGPVVDLKTVAEVAQRTGNVTRQPVSGQPRVTTTHKDRYLVVSA